MIFIAAFFLPFACFMAEALPPADQGPALQPKLFDFDTMPNDILDAIAKSVKDPRDFRSFSLAVSIADVPTKEINDHVMAILPKGFPNTGIESFRKHLDFGRIYTSQSPYIEHYKAIEGKLNPRTNKPFKFDSIWMEKGCQDDPVWQSWNWTNVKEVYFLSPVDPKHPELPLTRLNGLKRIDFNHLRTEAGYAIALEILKQNPEVEILKVFYFSYMPSQLAQTVCSLKKLSSLEVLKSKDFVEEVLTCLPADNHLKNLAISPASRNERIVADPAIIAKFRLNQLTCIRCDFGWTDFSGLERLTWEFAKDHDETVRVLEKLMSMKSLQYLRLEQIGNDFSPEEFKLIRQIALLIDEVEIFYPFGKGLVEALPEFQAVDSYGEFHKI